MEKMVIKQGEAKTVTFTVKDGLGAGWISPGRHYSWA